jgi:hypothetical protein
LEAELGYTKHGLTVAYSISVAVLVAVLKWNFMDIFGFAWHTTINLFIWLAIFGNQSDSEKRYRLYSSLPVSPRKLAVQDLVYVGLFHAGMVILWILFLVVGNGRMTARTFWALLSQNGFVLSLVATFIIHAHLGFFDTKLYRRGVYGLIIAVILAMATLHQFGHFVPLMRFLTSQLSLPGGAIVLNALALVLSYWSIVLFTRRKSYLA